MKTVGAYEAKTHLPSLLEEVAAGEHITITKHGVPVARLVPVADIAPAHPDETIRALKVFRAKHTLAGLSLRDLIDDGRRS
ncbi:MAG: type II toxin-antitoxin system prevent-host-death family antitoxin [Actinobacteria bacterium]|nr:type II toxin-antitoxin system prevent-host-death family antitoxin [Actinomycetota bacterium]